MPGQAALESGEAMDLSKLPKLSETKRTQHPAEDAPSPPLPPGEGRGEGEVEAPLARPSPQPSPEGRGGNPGRAHWGESHLNIGLSGAEAWISIAIGAILLVACHRPIEYLLTRHNPSAFSWSFADGDGNPLPYPKSAFFLPDLGIVLFGAVLILDGLLIAFIRSPRFVWFTFVLTLLAVALNLIAIVAAMDQIGFQLLSALAVAFGGYMAVYQWRLIQLHRAAGQRG
jgi:hypothetical protein